MKKIFLAGLRVLFLATIFTILLIVASAITTPPGLMQRMTPEQISQSTAMLPVASLIMTVMLACLALRSRWHGWKLAGALFLIFYVLYAVLGWIELLAFPAVSRQIPGGMLNGLLVTGLVVGLPISLLAVWILGKTKKNLPETQANTRLGMSAFERIWKVAIGAILYTVIYFTFGYYVAWRTPGLPEFYGGTDPGTFFGQLANIARDTPWLYALQIVRGLIWVGIGYILIRMDRGNAWETILTTGLTFTVIMNASLLIPNPFWPPLVARAHAVELVSSNLLYGILLSALMLWRPATELRVPRALPAAK